MADNEIKIKVTTDVANIPKQARASQSAIDKAGGFSGEYGAKRQQTINSLLGSIDALIAKGELGKKDIRDLNKYITELYSNLAKASTYTKNVSETMKKLIDVEQKARENLDAAKTNRNKILEGGKTNKKGSSFVSLEGFNERVGKAEYGIGGAYKINKDKTISKKKETNYENIVANIKDGKAQYVDAQGNPLQNNPEWQKMGSELNSANGQLHAATGSVNRFQEALDKATAAVEAQQKLEPNANPLPAQVGAEATAASTAIQNMDEEVSKAQGTASVDDPVKALDKQTSSLGKAFKAFSIYAIAVRGAKKALNDAIKTVKDLDKYLTEQAMVTGKTRKETYALLGTYQQMAKQLGTTSKEVANVATQYMRQGKTVTESIKLTEAAISAAKVAGIDATESVNYLTTALNGFQLAAEDAMKVSDKFAAVAASAAVSYEEIAIALSKVASQANLAGMSIDYTTALLAKGIETTREAPETIGTALKTVIARMREMSDYGETLAGDTDVNNVETQLAYIGIDLKNANGELRSTEDVLNDLGGKWDTLNTNQQAAVAKALAGTRQQSRLIAMMSDYERTIELQEIAQRSQGATLAQMETYLEGMDAALNNINVAWEQIVTALTNSDIIIGLVNSFGWILDVIGKILSKAWITIPLMAMAGVYALTVVNHKIREAKVAKQIEKSQQALNLLKLKEHKTELESELSALNKLKLTLEEKKANGTITAEEAKRLGTIDAEIQAKQGAIEQTNYQIEQAEAMNSISGNLNSKWKDFTSTLGTIGAFLFPIIGLIWKMVAATIAEKKATDAATQSEKKKFGAKLKTAAASMAESAGNIPVVGWIIAAAILATLIGVAIATAVNYSNSAEKASDDINNLSAEIYQLQKKADAIETATSKFEDLDNKVLKTKQDLEDMNKALDEAAEGLSTSAEDNTAGLNLGNTSEKAYYDSLTTTKAKKEFLEQVKTASTKQANADRQEQLNIINKLKARGGDEWDNFLTDASYSQARDAIYAINNSKLYDYIDGLVGVTDSAASATESLVQSMLEELDASQALQIANYPESIRQIAEQIANLKTELEVDGNTITTSLAEVLGGDDYNLSDRVKAFKEIQASLSGNSVALESFNSLYNEFEVFAKMNDDVLDFIDNAGLSVDKLNELYTGYENLQKAGMDITQEEYQSRYFDYLEALTAFNGDVASATKQVFGDLLDKAEDYTTAWNVLINNFGNLVEVGILNMGQNVDKFSNTIDDFYKKATEWSTMSETDKTQFISDNADLFSGSDGDKLLKAFESGNYSAIEQALAANTAFVKQRQKLLEEVEQELKVELAREGDDYNAAYIKQLQDYKSYLEDTNNLYRASLEQRLEQEENALNQYKEMLQKEHDATTEALDKRKEAYQQYFDRINQASDDEDYEEQADTLISNLAKLGSSTNADAMKQSKELEQQLTQLEEERLDELRQRAQEQVMTNIDDQITQINDKFDELIETNKALLDAFTQDSSNANSLVANAISQAVTSDGLTATGLEDFLKNLQNDWGSYLGDVNWNGISVGESSTNNNLTLNVNGQTIELGSDDQQSIYEVILKALQQVGYR